MLIELTLEELDAVLPLAPTGSQYSDYISNVFLNLERLIVAIGAGAALLVISTLFSETGVGFIFFVVGVLSVLYPFVWGPLFEISRRNKAYRELPYGWFFFGQIERVDSREVLVDEIEQIDANGDLYVEEVIEQELRLAIADETGMSFVVKTRDEPAYESIVPRQSAIALIKSFSPNLRSPVISEVYIVKLGQWVGDVSYLKRDEFLDLANDLVEMA
ncbi:hypothetical protein [Synechococcus sp. PCC 7336]|uniref:hypothetical protein n=1 Tax=Synechococcus sp. PCC 7336 TaxID=195250 RepID=UPI0003495BBB|nr:hypothetical protein [Synechococcus sp. PCC 7336]